MVIPDIVGGFTARRNPQLSSGVAQNLFPETQEPESANEPRRRVAMLPTHGFETFNDTHPIRVTGMDGSREPDERLLVMHGRELRVYRSAASTAPDSAIALPGQEDQNIRPAYGSMLVGATYYVVCDDGQVRSDDGTVVLSTDDMDGRTPLGMARIIRGGLTWVMLSFVDDRIVRAWRLTAGEFVREPQSDLDTSPADPDMATAMQCPESLTVDPVGNAWMIVCDGIGGVLYEYSFNPAGTPRWRLRTRPGVQNTFDLQLLEGSAEEREPLSIGGIYSDNTNRISFIEKTKRRVVTINRSTGVVLTSFNYGSLSDNNRRLGQGVPCSFVSGGPGQYYVNGEQYDDGMGRIWGFGVSGGLVRRNMPAARRTRFKQTKVLPFGDQGRLAGVLVDRRLHLIDLERNRMLQNVAGPLDTLTYGDRRFVGTDATKGRLKTSEIDQLVNVEDRRFGTPESAASVSVPLFPRDKPRLPLRGFYLGARTIVGVMGDESTEYPGAADCYVWDRSNLDAAPVRINGSTRVYGICVSADTNQAKEGQLYLLVGGASLNQVVLTRYSQPPRTAAEFASLRVTADDVNVTLPWNGERVRDIACDGTYLYIVASLSADSAVLQGRTYLMSSGSEVEARRLDVGASVENITADLTVASDNSWLRCVDTFDGRLYVGIQQPAPGQMVVRALTWDTTVNRWVRDGSHDIPRGITNNARALTHDGKFIYSMVNEPVQSALRDGTPSRVAVLAAFWVAVSERRGKYRWPPDLVTPAGVSAAHHIRGRLLTWSPTEMKLWNPRLPTPQNPFPFAEVASRRVGIVAFDSLTVVENILYWLGRTTGGGLRAWNLGMDGDLTPMPIESKSVEEVLDTVAQTPGAVEGAIGWSDDTGGHPTAVFTLLDGQVTLAYDQSEELWHTRASRRLGTLPAETPYWWQKREQGAQRVTNSCLWNNRLTLGGFGEKGGIVAFADFENWRDIDGGLVERVRMAKGVNPERRDVKRPFLRVDACYGVRGIGTTLRDVNPRFRVEISDDGGRTFHDTVRSRPLNPRGGRPPRAIYLLGHSQYRVYRVSCSDPVEFIILGAYQFPPEQVVSVKF